MERIRQFNKKEPVFVITAVCTFLSILVVPPSAAYADYVNWPVLVLLFCLMAVVAGCKQSGIFEWLSQTLLSKTDNVKSIGIVLLLLCFLSSMLITNDVALLTFVPLTIGLFSLDRGDRLIFMIVMETVAANLGSLVTPIGNPQNLYLFSAYHLDAGSFFRITLPLGGICLLLITPITLFAMHNGRIHVAFGGKVSVNKRDSLKYLVLFVLCLLTVLRILNCWICLATVLVVLLLTDRKIFGKVDYVLLLTFLCFFLFVGNIAQIPVIRESLSKIITGREMVVSALLSQGISNVPAAVMLSSFTGNAKALLLGVNIGGLGTPVASLASLISFKLYCGSVNSRKGRYLAVFSVINFALLAVLLIIAELIL